MQSVGRLCNHIFDHPGDHPANQLVHQSGCLDARMLGNDLRQNLANETNRAEIIESEELRAQPIIYVMCIVSDIIGNRGDLRLKTWKAPKLQITALVIALDGYRDAALA